MALVYMDPYGIEHIQAAWEIYNDKEEKVGHAMGFERTDGNWDLQIMSNDGVITSYDQLNVGDISGAKKCLQLMADNEYPKTDSLLFKETEPEKVEHLILTNPNNRESIQGVADQDSPNRAYVDDLGEVHRQCAWEILNGSFDAKYAMVFERTDGDWDLQLLAEDGKITAYGRGFTDNVRDALAQLRDMEPDYLTNAVLREVDHDVPHELMLSYAANSQEVSR